MPSSVTYECDSPDCVTAPTTDPSLWIRIYLLITDSAPTVDLEPLHEKVFCSRACLDTYLTNN